MKLLEKISDFQHFATIASTVAGMVAEVNESDKDGNGIKDGPQIIAEMEAMVAELFVARDHFALAQEHLAKLEAIGSAHYAELKAALEKLA